MDRNTEEQLDNIQVEGKDFLKQKIIINEGEKLETLRIYATDDMMNILEDKNYTHFFLDGTFKSVPKGIYLYKLILDNKYYLGPVKENKKNNSQLMICLGYNSTHNFFSVAFMALLQSKNYEIYEKLHLNLKALKKKFNPEFLTVDFEHAHLLVIIT